MPTRPTREKKAPGPKLDLRSLAKLALLAIPIAAALWVWLSPLSFVPVPWPDDSAFYFVARELFRWPPRWVMLSQAPFEPTYRIWNFNTMPLYPVLIGLGRFLGIDGSWALKIWPLGFWAASGAALTWGLLEAGLPLLFVAAITLVFSMDPTLRWASVLIRPESLIGFFGMLLVLGLSLGWYDDEPKAQQPYGGLLKTARSHARATLRDPVAWLLALAAYAHFNAVHLVFPVLVAFAFKPRRIIATGLRTTALLAPWLATVAWHFDLFQRQMTTQWGRLAVPNGWLASFDSAIHGMFQNMGSPLPWPDKVYLGSYWLWALVFLAAAGLIFGLSISLRDFLSRKGFAPAPKPLERTVNLAPAGAWVVSSFWLWNAKPEVWFTYYLHESLWCFAGIAALFLWTHRNRKAVLAGAWGLIAGTAACALIFLSANIEQADALGATRTWNWDAYHQLIDCIDRQLIAEEARHDAQPGGSHEPFQVWDPTFPDVTIELSRRHPSWELTRTNDFYSRDMLAIRHGEEVDAVVVPESINWQERWIDAPMEEHPEIQSLWMNWQGYYLHKLPEEPGWKPRRHLCQVGRWQAFIYLK